MGKPKSLKKGDSKALAISHPNSRKAKSLAKKVIRASTRDKIKNESAVKRNLLYGEKLVWFQENLEPGSEYSASMLDNLFEKYLRRFDEELEQIAIKHSIGKRKGRQHANREDIIKLTKKREFEEYNTCGIEMVDILSPKQLKLFREWDGNLGVHFNIRRFSKPFLLKFKPSNQCIITDEKNSSEEKMHVEAEQNSEVTTDCRENYENETDKEKEENSDGDQLKSSMDMEESVT